MSADIGAIPKLVEAAITFAVQYSFQILGGLVILVVGYKLAAYIAAYTARLGRQRALDPTLNKFLAGSARITILALAIVAALSNFGITIAPLIAAIGAAAFGATIAIQGPLSNFGAGLSIILTRPFVVGNTITVKGFSGVVEEIDLASTVLIGEDGERITVPNKQIVGEILVNSHGSRLFQSVVRAAGTLPIDAIVADVQTALAAHADVAQSPEPQVGILNIAADSALITVRCWIPSKTYYPSRFSVNRTLHEIYRRHGLGPAGPRSVSA